MTPGAIVVIIGVVVTVCTGLLTAAAALALLYGVSKIQPVATLEARVSGLQAMVDNLEAQIIQLRTRKAAKASPRTKTKEELAPDSEDDPLLEGLSVEERAMFQ